MNTKKAYQDILDVCSKYSSELGDVKDMEDVARGHLTVIDWEEKYGIKVSESFNPCKWDYYRVNDFMMFSYFKDAKLCKKEGRGRSIGWEDNNKQPEDGWILSIGFSTGAYIFGDDYDEQTNLFQEFFQELKTYNPDFVDSQNHDLYWRIENAKNIYLDFNEILKKYKDKNASELKNRKIKKLKQELESLEKPL